MENLVRQGRFKCWGFVFAFFAVLFFATPGFAYDVPWTPEITCREKCPDCGPSERQQCVRDLEAEVEKERMQQHRANCKVHPFNVRCIEESSAFAKAINFKEYGFLYEQLLFVIGFYAVGFLLGRRVQKGKLSADISRKFLILILLFINGATIVFFALWHGEGAKFAAFGEFGTPISSLILSCAVVLFLLFTLSRPFRDRIPVLKTVFASLNHLRDEPYTLRWLSTEVLAVCLIVVCFVYYSLSQSRYAIDYPDFYTTDYKSIYHLTLIPFFAWIGNALTEIIGKKWGRHPYMTRSLLGGRTCTRSLEGSAMMFLTTAIICWVVGQNLSSVYVTPLITLPFTLTWAQAKAPHRWDNLFVYLVGYLTIIFVADRIFDLVIQAVLLIAILSFIRYPRKSRNRS